jgi:hypothetical protein
MVVGMQVAISLLMGLVARDSVVSTICDQLVEARERG